MARPRKAKESPPSNVTDETIAEYANKIRTADLDVEEAHVVYKGAVGVRRNIVKAAIAAGVPTDALLQTLKDAKQDKSKVLDLIRDRARCSAILQLPIGHQFGLLEGDALPETDPTLASRVKADHAAILGYQAGRALADREENPYEAGTEEYAKWDERWLDGNQEHFTSENAQKTARAKKGATDVAGPEMGEPADGEETWGCPLGKRWTGPVIDDATLLTIKDAGFDAFTNGQSINDVPSVLSEPGRHHWRYGFSLAEKMGAKVTNAAAE